MRDWAFYMIVLTASAGATVAVLIFDDEVLRWLIR